jgi:hypothetical protein
MVAIKNSGASRRGAGKSQRGLHRFGPEIWEKRRGVRPARRPWGMRPSGLGSGRSPSSTFLRVSRTVGSLRPMAGDPSRRRGPGYRSPSRHKDIVRLPAGMSFEADGLERPDHLIVEMACAGDSAPTHAGEQLRDFQGQAPEFKGIVAGAMEMPQVRLIFCAAVPSPAARIYGSRATRTSRVQRHQILDLGQRISPKTRGRGRRRDGRPLTIFAF